ncbi:MAG: shikimate kinase [Actinomycetia bacterium]|nr:shikimate kinase [Actinomycetes bacterium]
MGNESRRLKPCPHIALVGFSGAGKSTVASEIAPRLGRPCIDTDANIEAACGKTIPEIFADEGEAFFRARESEELARALESTPAAVIACGGGVVESSENFALLQKQAVVVYLRVATEFALARIDELHSRPLLAEAGTGEVIAALMASRIALYEALAELSINTNYRNVSEVCDTLIARIRKAGYEL